MGEAGSISGGTHYGCVLHHQVWEGRESGGVTRMGARGQSESPVAMQSIQNIPRVWSQLQQFVGPDPVHHRPQGPPC